MITHAHVLKIAYLATPVLVIAFALVHVLAPAQHVELHVVLITFHVIFHSTACHIHHTKCGTHHTFHVTLTTLHGQASPSRGLPIKC